VFPEENVVPSKIMRRCLQAACAAIGYEPKEINPKAENVGDGVGNYVRLPYNNHLSEWENLIHPTRHIGADVPTTLQVFLPLAHGARTPTMLLEEVAALYTPPEIGHVAVEAMPIDKTITDKMSGRTWTIYKDGPLPGSDRSSTMTRLAHLMAEDGLTPSEAYAVLAACHFNKYRDRKDEAEQLQRIIDRAYS
jgi:hypothetical protein